MYVCVLAPACGVCVGEGGRARYRFFHFSRVPNPGKAGWEVLEARNVAAWWASFNEIHLFAKAFQMCMNTRVLSQRKKNT